MTREASIWPGKGGAGITTGLFYGNLRRYLIAAGLPPSGVHVLRHAAAKLRRDAGQSIEEVSRFLDHSSLAVTSTYLLRIEVTEDAGWAGVAQAIGL
jgi:integrase